MIDTLFKIGFSAFILIFSLITVPLALHVLPAFRDGYAGEALVAAIGALAGGSIQAVAFIKLWRK